MLLPGHLTKWRQASFSTEWCPVLGVWKESLVLFVSITHIKIDGVCSFGGMTTHSSGQAGFTIACSRGNLMRNNSLDFGSIKLLYSNLNFRRTDFLVCLSFSVFLFFCIIDF
jgi:hypothetical protein